MDYNEALQKLSTIGQQHLLRFWDVLSSIEKSALLYQIERLNIDQFYHQRKIVDTTHIHAKSQIEPFYDYALAGNVKDQAEGRRLISKGEMGCLLVAGGQGTRLRFDGPKGLFPVSVVAHKSLFQIFAEKVVAASRQANHQLPLAIMTSPLNHQSTVDFFMENHLFGLQASQLQFFSQEMLPLLDLKGDLFLENRSTLAAGPDGNGSAFKHFVENGIWDRWHEQGVRYVNFVLIDNPLADPFDAELLGFHSRLGADITIKCTTRRDAKENVGIVVKKNGRVEVVEYSELSIQERAALDVDGCLKHQCANISLFCFNMEFIKYAAAKFDQMPQHAALKTFPRANVQGVAIKPVQPESWKFETFIFDLLPWALHVFALQYPREYCFAPLKNAIGPDSLEDVQQALQEEARRIYREVTGLPPPNHPFELDPQFFYPISQKSRT